VEGVLQAQAECEARFSDFLTALLRYVSAALNGSAELKPAEAVEPKPAKAKVKRVSRKLEYTPEFETAWSMYPRREEGKYAAFEKWNARLKDGYTVEQLTQATANFALDMANKERKYIMHGVKFFGRGEWFVAYIKGIPKANRLKRQDSTEKYARLVADVQY